MFRLNHRKLVYSKLFTSPGKEKHFLNQLRNTKKFINVLFGILGIGMLGIGGYVYHVVADYEVKN